MDQTRYHEILVLAQQFFRSNITETLYTDIQKRWGFTKEQTDHLGIGYAPQRAGGLQQYLANAQVQKNEMLLSGLVKEFGALSSEDVFRGRIILPWLNTQQQPEFFVGFDPEFDQEKLLVNEFRGPLFGSSQLREHSLETLDCIYIVENTVDAFHLLLRNIPVLTYGLSVFNESCVQELQEITEKYNVPLYICFPTTADNKSLEHALNVGEFFSKTTDIHILVLPSPQGERSQTLTDFFREGGTKEQLLELQTSAVKKTNFQRLWQKIKLPFCVQQLINGASISRNYKPQAMTVVGKEMVFTMKKSWEDVLNVFQQSFANTTADTLTAVSKTLFEVLPVSNQIHSCAWLLTHPFIRKICKIDNCYHVSEDYPQELRASFDMQNIMELLKQIRMVRLPREYTDKDNTYELIFPVELFGYAASFTMTDSELFKDSKVFEKNFLATFHEVFQVPGKTRDTRRMNWNALLRVWYQNLEYPYEKEQAGTVVGLQEDFLRYLDECQRYYYSFEMKNGHSFPFDESVYYIPEDVMLYVPVALVRKYLTEKKYEHNLSQFRFYCREVLAENSFSRRIANKSIRLWSIPFTEERFPQIHDHYVLQKDLKIEELH